MHYKEKEYIKGSHMSSGVSGNYEEHCYSGVGSCYDQNNQTTLISSFDNIYTIVVAFVAFFTLIALLITLIVGVSNAKNDNVSVSEYKLTWNVGSIKVLDGNSNEKIFFDSSDKFSLTSDPVKIDKGIKIEVNPEKNITYLLSFYDDNDIYLGVNSSEFVSDSFEITFDEIIELYPEATSFRLCLYNICDDDNGINKYEIKKLTKCINVYSLN